jgi:hypothetical protein
MATRSPAPPASSSPKRFASEQDKVNLEERHEDDPIGETGGREETYALPLNSIRLAPPLRSWGLIPCDCLRQSQQIDAP